MATILGTVRGEESEGGKGRKRRRGTEKSYVPQKEILYRGAGKHAGRTEAMS